jgi:hypothetical protein
VPLPYNFLSLAQWLSLFDDQGLTEVTRSTYKMNRLEPAKHILAKLQVQEAPMAMAADHGRPEKNGRLLERVMASVE